MADQGIDAGALGHAHVRIARPTRDLAAVTRFYVEGLGFTKLGGFVDHAGIDGVMLGYPGAGYHLEWTYCALDPVSPAPTPEDLLVLYLPHADVWPRAVDRLVAWGCEAVLSANPYWDVQGRTFVDPDGYRVVLQHAENSCVTKGAG